MKEQTLIGIIIILGIVIGLYYYSSTSTPGISVSCITRSIDGFRNVPPPLANIYQTSFCIVDIEAKVLNNVICSGNFTIYSEKGVIPCNELSESINQTILITGEFFDPDGKPIGTDQKSLMYTGK